MATPGLGSKVGRKKKKLTKKIKAFIVEKTQEGWTDAEIIIGLRSCTRTYYNWKKEYSDFFDKIKELKYISDLPVVNALRRNATGFKYEERHYDLIDVIDNETGQIKQDKKLIKLIEKYSLPETAACMCWLTNRFPELWRHRQHMDLTSGGDKLPGSVALLPDNSNMTEEEAKKAYEQMINEEKAKKQ
jgi:hypothetical protein